MIFLINPPDPRPVWKCCFWRGTKEKGNNMRYPRPWPYQSQSLRCQLEDDQQKVISGDLLKFGNAWENVITMDNTFLLTPGFLQHIERCSRITARWDKTGREYSWSFLEEDMKNGWVKKAERGNGYEWKERKNRGRNGGKETLITETLTHKREEADTSGNQRNASQLEDTSIHPALWAVFLLSATSGLFWVGGWWIKATLKQTLI